MSNPNSEKEKAYKIIQQHKRKGDIQAIATELQRSRQWVSWVCSPRFDYWDDNVIAAMLKRIEERRGDARKVIQKHIKKYAA